MRTLKRLVGLAVLAGFFSLIAIECCHQHVATQNTAERNCAVCRVAHETPSVAATPQLPQPETLTEASPSFKIRTHAHVSVFDLHSLSPPAL